MPPFTHPQPTPRLERRSQTQAHARFERAIGDDAFIDAAERLLRQGADVVRLARSAEYAVGRMPGGPYYRARLWHLTSELLRQTHTLQESRRLLGMLATGSGSDARSVREQVRIGALLVRLERRRTNMSGLMRASHDLLRRALRNGEKAEQYLQFANRHLRRDAALSDRQINTRWCEEHGPRRKNLDIVKPSDWWAFSWPKWRQPSDFPGSIPGEVYANALYYFAPRSGIAVDPMAGSGMLRRVYRDRQRWQKESEFRLKIRLYDLAPRRSYIRRHDARKKLPVVADWIFLDPPYFGQSRKLYKGALAEARSYPEYLRELREIIEAMAASLRVGGRLCLFLPKWSGQTPRERNRDVPSDATAIARAAGLVWHDAAYVSRGRQQTPGFAVQNAQAKRTRRMLSDTCVLTVLVKEA